MEKNNLSVPVAIIVAGILIAGAVFFSFNNNGAEKSAFNKDNTAKTSAPELDINPIDSTDHILGNPGAEVVLVDYSDTECPFCKRFHGTMQQLMKEYAKEGKFAWVYRHLPVPQLHKKAQKEAEALECAAEQGGSDAFWKYTDRLYEITPSNDGLAESQLPQIAQHAGLDIDEFNSCLSSGKHAARVQRDVDDAHKVNLRATPSSVLIVRDGVSERAQNFIGEIKKQNNIGDDSLAVSADKKRVMVVGAFPLEMMSQLIETLTTN